MEAPSAFMGMAARHIHSHHGMLDVNDVENAVGFMVEGICKPGQETFKSFTALPN